MTDIEDLGNELDDLHTKAERLCTALARCVWLIDGDGGELERTPKAVRDEAVAAMEGYRGGTVDGAGELLEPFSEGGK